MKIKNISIGILSVLLLASCGSNTVFHTHEYGNTPVWEWDGYTSATATFECLSCLKEEEGHYFVLNANIESEITTNPTCNVEGIKTYTAEVTYNEVVYQDFKTESIAPTGHTYTGPIWEWSDDYSSAKAVFTCSSCLDDTEGHKISVNADISSVHTPGTCIIKEKYVYTAVAAFDDETYQDSKEQELGYGDHKYGEFHVEQDPTYDEEGTKKRTCELCGNVDIVSIPKLVISYSEGKPILLKANNLDPSDVYSGDYYEKALKTYSYLDETSMTLDEKFEANEIKNSIESLYDEWKTYYSKIIDINDLDAFTNVDMEVIDDPDGEKGVIRKFESTLNGGEAWSYANIRHDTLSGADYVTFGFYQDQPGDLLCVNSNYSKYLDLMTGEVYNSAHVTKNVLYHQWNQITISSETWEEMGDFMIGIYLTYDKDYGIRTTGEPAYLTSIYSYKVPSEEGQTIIKGADNITDVHTWGANSSSSVITYNVSSEHGNATKIDIKAKTNVLELKWANVNYATMAKFDYARIYIYAKTTQRVFISLNNWRNNVVNIPGVEPFASDNGTQANNVQNLANVVANQWNIIDVPTSYFMQDTNDNFFIEIWADKNEAQDSWLFTDFVGHYSDQCIENAGSLVEGLTTATVNLSCENDQTYGTVQKVVLAASKGYIKQRSTMNISEFDTLSFDVYNDSLTDLSLYLYKLNTSTYGNAVKGSYLVLALTAQNWTHVEININEYFGSYASAASIMFRIDGAIGNTIYLSSIYGKNNEGGHQHLYGNLITSVPASCEKDGVVAHYHCDQCGKNFDENKVEIDSVVIPAFGHSYEEENDKYICSRCHNELNKEEELVIKQEKTQKQYIFLGSSICNGYHGPNVSECTSMADFFSDDYLLASYTGLSNGAQVSVENIYLRRITNNGTNQEPYLGIYSYDYDKLELKTNGNGLFNEKPFNYIVENGRIIISGPSSHLYKFNAVFYGNDNVIKKACNGFTLSDYQPRWANQNQEVTDRHSYVGLMEELLNQYSGLHVDEFVVQLSTNDLGIYTDQTCTEHVPFGSITADDVRESSQFDKSTSFGALEWIIAKAKEVWGCKVTIFTCQMYDADYTVYKNNNYDIQSLASSNYFQMYLPCLAIAEKWGTGLIDIYANKEAEIKLNENKNRYKADIVHLTEIGYEAVLYQLFREFFDKQ